MSAAPKQTEAQRLADILEKMPLGECDHEAAALLRRQDELLRQALEALETDDWQKKMQAAIAIRAHREAK